MTLRYICLSKLNKSGIRIENQPTGLKNFEQSIGAKIETLRFSVLELWSSKVKKKVFRIRKIRDSGLNWRSLEQLVAQMSSAVQG